MYKPGDIVLVGKGDIAYAKPEEIKKQISKGKATVLKVINNDVLLVELDNKDRVYISTSLITPIDAPTTNRWVVCYRQGTPVNGVVLSQRRDNRLMLGSDLYTSEEEAIKSSIAMATSQAPAEAYVFKSVYVSRSYSTIVSTPTEGVEPAEPIEGEEENV